MRGRRRVGKSRLTEEFIERAGVHLRQLVAQTARLPGADASPPLIAVSRSGVSPDGIHPVGPGDLLAAYQSTQR